MDHLFPSEYCMGSYFVHVATSSFERVCGRKGFSRYLFDQIKAMLKQLFAGSGIEGQTKNDWNRPARSKDSRSCSYEVGGCTSDMILGQIRNH